VTKNIFDTLKQKPFLTAFFIIIFILIIYLPSLDNYIMGDDFEWLNNSYIGWQNPAELFKPINNFFRPMVKLSYLLIYTFFRAHVFYYNLFTVFIHLINIFMLYYLIFKITSRVPPAALISLLYGTSAFYSEVTLWSSGRPDALLLTFMLPPLIILSNRKKNITWMQYFWVFFFALCALATKETWILLPFLILTFLWIVKSESIKTIFKQTFSLFILLVLYLGYFIVLPKLSGQTAFTSYASAGFDKIIKKFGFIIYKYIGLDNLYTGTFWQVLLIAILLLVLTVWLIHRNNRLALWGLVFMLITIGITLPIDHFPSRYSHLPLLGFWILVVTWLEQDFKSLFKKLKIRDPIAFLIISIPIAFYLANQTIMLQWEIKDYHLRGSAHKELVEMYLKVRDQISHQRPIIFIDQGKRRAIDELYRVNKGYRKLLFPRKDAIWQLVYLSPLANFVGNPFSEKMEPLPEKELDSVFQNPFTVLVFTDKGFHISAFQENIIQEYYERYHKLPPKTQALKFTSIKEK